MNPPNSIGAISKPWFPIVLGVIAVATSIYGVVAGKALNESFAAFVVVGLFLGWAIWKYHASRAVVFLQTADGLMVLSKGVTIGPIAKVVLTERLNVRPWHYSVSATCEDGGVVTGALFPPLSMCYSRTRFRAQLEAFLHPLATFADKEVQGRPTELH